MVSAQIREQMRTVAAANATARTIIAWGEGRSDHLGNSDVEDAIKRRFAREKADHRAALVRAVLASQWAVAVTLVFLPALGRSADPEWASGSGWRDAARIAALPSPDDVVADLLGEVRS